MLSHHRITTSSIDDSLLAGLPAVQCEAITAHHEALLNAIMRREPSTVASILAEPSPVPLVHVTFGTENGTFGLTALHHAVNFANPTACRLLIEAGARLNAKAFIRNDGPFTPLDWARIALENPALPTGTAKRMKEATRLLERASDDQGTDAEMMQVSVNHDQRRGKVIVSVVNKHTGDVLNYGRARLASDRAMNMPAVMRGVVELMTGEKPDENVMIMAVEAGAVLN